MLKEIRAKVKTYDGMYYTYGVINENTSDVVEFKRLCGEIDEETGLPKEITEDIELEEKLKAVAGWCLDELKCKLEKDKFIFCRPDDKIINVKEIKETILNEF